MVFVTYNRINFVEYDSKWGVGEKLCDLLLNTRFYSIVLSVHFQLLFLDRKLKQSRRFYLQK